MYFTQQETDKDNMEPRKLGIQNKNKIVVGEVPK